LLVVLAIGLTSLLGACNLVTPKTTDGETFAVAAKTEVGSVIVTDDVIEGRSVTIPTYDLPDGHFVFGLAKHPTEPWLYATTFNECGVADDWCWGDAAIHLFTVGDFGVVYQREVYSYYDDGFAECSLQDWGYDVQVGACAPVGFSITPDGTRLIAKEDNNDTWNIFTIAEDGALEMVFEGDNADLHGVAIDPTGQYVYNGLRVLRIEDDTLVTEVSDTGGNGTTYLERDSGPDLLVTAVGNSSVYVLDPSDPAAPTVIDSVSLGGAGAINVAVSADGSRLVATGRDVVTSLSFDGTTLTVDDQYTFAEPEQINNRGVALTADGTKAVVGWFTNLYGPPGWNGGYMVYDVAADGTLSVVEAVDEGTGVRTVLNLSR
jgi:hypothetical protein